MSVSAPVAALSHSLHRAKIVAGNFVAVPAELAAAWTLREGAVIAVKTGKAVAQAAVRLVSASGEADISAGAAVLERLGIAGMKTLNCRYERGTLHVGPTVGIFAPRRSGHSRPYQAQTSLFKRVIAAGQELGIPVYVFDFHDIRWGEKRVRGYTLSGGRWIGRNFPLPDVVYDRATGSFPGGASAADAARRRLVRGHGVKLFNTRVGNKWRLHRIMYADLELRRHLPPTQRAGPNTVAAVLARHQGAYLKPQNGAQGKRIIRLRRAKGRIVYTLTTDSYERVRGSAASVAGALSQLRHRVSLAGYLVQPELSLIRVDGRICDIRALVQRDEAGRWQVTGVGVRAGPPGSVVSNLHGGGRALRLEQVLSRALDGDQERVQEICLLIRHLALRVAEVVAKATSCLGELGVDLGVDRQGRVWIIEANSRTGRATFRRAGLHEAARLADRRPLFFAMYLAGFTPQ